MERRKIFQLAVLASMIIVLIIILSILIETFFSGVGNFFSDTGEIKEFIMSFGVLSPVIFILLNVLQVIIAPIPGQITGFLGGALFGVWLGTLYSTIGTVLGTFIVVVLARKFGEPLVKKWINKKIYKKFSNFSEEKGAFSLFLVYLLPFLPDDLISMMAGLSKIKIKYIVLVAFLGRLPGMFLLSLAGAGIVSSDPKISLILAGIIILFCAIVYIYRDRLEKKAEKLFHNIKNRRNHVRDISND